MKIEFENLTEFLKDIEEIEKNINKKSKNILNKVINGAETEAKEYAPVDTGNLRNRIKASEVEEKNGVYEAELISEAEYSAYVEFGTGDKGEASIPEAGKKLGVTYTKGWRRARIAAFFLSSSI